MKIFFEDFNALKIDPSCLFLRTFAYIIFICDVSRYSRESDCRLLLGKSIKQRTKSSFKPEGITRENVASLWMMHFCQVFISTTFHCGFSFLILCRIDGDGNYYPLMPHLGYNSSSCKNKSGNMRIYPCFCANFVTFELNYSIWSIWGALSFSPLVFST